MKKRIVIPAWMLLSGFGSVSAQIALPKDTLLLQRTPTETLTLQRTASDTLTLQRNTPIYNTTVPIYAPIYTPVPVTTELVTVASPKKIKTPYHSTHQRVAAVSEKKRVHHKKQPHRAHHEQAILAVHKPHKTHPQPKCPDMAMNQGAVLNYNSPMDANNAMAMIRTWPAAAQLAITETIAKYGNPDMVTTEEFIWLNKGVWNKICITKQETKHNFPMEHTDMMQTTINYKVPVGLMDDLGKFDGSITFDRTQGTMSARCDSEPHNFLALNLANDIITAKKTVQEARNAFSSIVKQKINGENPVYMQQLNFFTHDDAPDPDKHITHLTQAEKVKMGEQ
ncbi:MAG: hypothetical protein RLZZ628_1947 [Bacteroidota bacterium]|jgi:hypothetical protein